MTRIVRALGCRGLWLRVLTICFLMGVGSPALADYICYGPYASASSALAARDAGSLGVNQPGSNYTLGNYSECTMVGNYVYSTCTSNYVSCRRYVSAASCPAGTTANSAGLCVAVCQYNSAIASTDPACGAPPPTCSHVDGDEGTTGEYPRSVMGGGPYCDGSCTYSLPFVVGIASGTTSTECFNYESDPVLYCNLTQSFNGEACSSANNPATSSGSGSPTSTVVCAPGSVDNGAGGCVTGSSSGTTGTPTAGGGASSAGAVSCPAGYSQDPITFKCSGAPTASGCPAGTSLEGTVCVSAGTGPAPAYGSGAGTSANAVGSCGGPGQPGCRIDESGSNDGGIPAGVGGTAVGGVTGRTGAANAGAIIGDLSALGVPFLGTGAMTTSGDEPAFGLGGSDGCANPTSTIMGHAMELPICMVVSPMKLILAWALNLFLVLYAWSAWTRKKGV